MALAANTFGQSNTGLGTSALLKNTTASNNTALGSATLLSNTTGANNTAVGYVALSANITGSNNISVGPGSLNNNTTGSYNTTLGYYAGSSTNSGNYNIVIGSPTFPGTNGLTTSYSGASYEMNIGNTLFGINIDSTIGVGKVGINTRTPSATLHVKGTARIDTLLSGAITDSVVTADVNGNLHKASPLASLKTVKVAYTATGTPLVMSDTLDMLMVLPTVDNAVVVTLPSGKPTGTLLTIKNVAATGTNVMKIQATEGIDDPSSANKTFNNMGGGSSVQFVLTDVGGGTKVWFSITTR
jgi:hypothetical protein